MTLMSGARCAGAAVQVLVAAAEGHISAGAVSKQGVRLAQQVQVDPIGEARRDGPEVNTTNQ